MVVKVNHFDMKLSFISAVLLIDIFESITNTVSPGPTGAGTQLHGIVIFISLSVIFLFI